MNEDNIRDKSDNDADYEPLYVYEDEEEEVKLDNSPLNYSQVTDEDVKGETIKEKNINKKPVSPFILLLKVLSNPVEGWKEVRRRKLTVEEAQRNCFYPLLSIMALCYFAKLFYAPAIGLSEVIVSAVTAFVGFFAGYFCIMILVRFLLPTSAALSVDTDYGKVFIILNLSSLCLFFSLLELLPMLWDVLIFLPLWTVYVICKGTRFFNFPENKKIQCIGILCLLVVGVPVLIEWGLNEVLPN